ncbi:hypothetical protein [Streptomyces glaucescens]|uniref:Putative secreted protein n=1 Tax=Streptomyces glaucescens TaxID=1907 RepID=A0A089XCT8_STRGA|nr:hypothetical protein [Streptomyces glaucescens]AIS01788.1 putative secreted protein [Streptomyces glaucescens]
MRAIRVASAALLGLTALGLTAPAAHARGDETGFQGTVLPRTIPAGGQVTLHAVGCATDVRISSGIFEDVVIRKGESHAKAVVDRDVEAGASYEIRFHCGTFWRTSDVTVAGGRPSRPPTPAPIVPSRGAHAGEGGTAAGFDLRETGLGVLLVTGSVGAAYLLSRRRTGDDGA